MASELKLLLLVHTAATLFMTGAIFIVQIVHYPLFRFVGADAFPAYQAAHMDAITLVVGPAMLLEAITGLLLAGAVGTNAPFTGVGALLAWVGLGLIGVAWLVTMCISVPQHSQLMGGFDSGVHAALVASNWIRTLAWTARAGIVLALLWIALG
ncbi:MAG: hypothetical protein SF162_20505 [bacterium]|nr:hypothetical protein [bacterium]